ncbi:MAG: hypothetical protein IPO78_08710 [Saprospiraceae bacterium]|nr:hypothetical protein [Saprospiraceae bacterium]
MFNHMTFKQLCFITGILFYSLNGFSQPSMQFKFCGKTAAVVPATDNGGNDQRHKGGLRLDLIRIGRLGQSRTSPFFSLGVTLELHLKIALGLMVVLQIQIKHTVPAAHLQTYFKYK